MMQNSINVRIIDEELWKQFHPQTEMIVTKKGRALFPKLGFRAYGLLEDEFYAVDIHFERISDMKFKFDKGVWSEVSKGEPNPYVNVLRHPAGFLRGDEWMSMKNIEFKSLKITNNAATTEPWHIVLQSMHKYMPVITFVPILDNTYNMMAGTSQQHPNQVRFEIAQFIAVTAYQNQEITDLKVKHNKYARGFRSDSNRKRAHSVEQEPSGSSSVSPQDSLFENPAKRVAWPEAPYYPQQQYMQYGAANMYYQQDQMFPAYNTYPMATAAYQQMGTEQMAYNAAASYWPMMPTPIVPPTVPTTFEQSPHSSNHSAINYSISP